MADKAFYFVRLGNLVIGLLWRYLRWGYAGDYIIWKDVPSLKSLETTLLGEFPIQENGGGGEANTILKRRKLSKKLIIKQCGGFQLNPQEQGHSPFSEFNRLFVEGRSQTQALRFLNQLCLRLAVLGTLQLLCHMLNIMGQHLQWGCENSKHTLTRAF